MSFSKNIKIEVLSKNAQSNCCGLAFLSGLINSSATIDTENMQLFIGTELKELCDVVNAIVYNIYKENTSYTSYKDKVINKDTYYKITFPQSIAKRIMIDTSVIDENQGKIKRNENIDKYLIQDECCLKSFVAGVFVGSGTSSIMINEQQRTSTGYHLEFVGKNYQLLSTLAGILAQFDIFAKLVQRKKMYVLYVKEAGEVSNVLALIGAYNAVLELQNEMATREVRNKVNRQTNCINANINKTVDASMKQTDAIQNIINKIGLEALPEDLQVVALLRLANSEESLEELLKLSKLPLTKSALNHRFQKLIKISEKLK